jgi:uncharacterized protein YegP (UPF0339 family)
MSTILIYTAENNEFAWHLKDDNGQVVATGHETFTRYEDAARSVANVIREFRKDSLGIDIGSMSGNTDVLTWLDYYRER